MVASWIVMGVAMLANWPGSHALGPPGLAGVEAARLVAQAEEPPPEAEEIDAAEVGAADLMPSEVVDGAAATTQAEGEGEWVLQNTRDLVSTDESKRPWHLNASLEYRGLFIVDPDPANDTTLRWRLGGSFDVFERMRAWVNFGLRENFTAEVGESGFLFEDSALGVDYGHEVKLDAIPLAFFKNRSIDFEHRLGVFLPTSRYSYNQGLYLAPYALSRARFAVIESLIVGVDAFFRYRFHKYAEQAGQDGGLNTQLDFGGSLGAEYTAYTHKEWGTVTVGADLSTSWAKKYPSSQTFSSPASSRTSWQQDSGWDLYATYTPLAYLTVVAGLETSVDILRDGIIVKPTRLIPGNRDDTQLFVQLLGRY